MLTSEQMREMRELRAKRARQYLVALSVLVGTAATTATGTYSYPETLKAIRGPMIFIHDASGDIALVISGMYLWNHLTRTWRMKKQRTSRWTGIIVVALWCVAGVTGLYGHFLPLEHGGWPWRLHFVCSVATIVIVCFHGAWAYRPRKRAAKPGSGPNGD
jgi:hypothetical protein